jgi:hypothetical protein
MIQMSGALASAYSSTWRVELTTRRDCSWMFQESKKDSANPEASYIQHAISREMATTRGYESDFYSMIQYK